MKKIFFISVLILTAAVSLSAEKLSMIQGTYLNTSRNYDWGSFTTKENYSEAGITYTYFNGKGIGIYSSTTIALPFAYKAQIDGREVTGVSIDAYDRFQIGIDMLIGPGFLVNLNPRFSILAAGGLHFNGIALISDNYMIDPYLAYNLGPGLAINGLLNLTDHFNINLSYMMAWDRLEFVTMPELDSDVTAKGGLTFAISAGLGFKY
ncbi:MAG: hypothetical protein JEY91_05765 [Spirochaetaceae bacterium]|nr:hypothetical protein [Spirochaetaceae bacterium]